jgi:hypothetical protein
MSEPKTFASLGPTLLARKGGAKPAMRPQLAPLTAMGGSQAAQALSQDLDEELEDLGWNDMGEEEDDDGYDAIAQEAQIFSLTPAPVNPDAEAVSRVVDAVARAEMAAAAGEPEVLRQRRDVVASIASPVREPAQREPVRRKAPEKIAAKSDDFARRAAFTLRLDAKRHLKLRLASTVKNRSAQQLVTAALDKYLAEIPEIEALAAQVTRD